MALTTPLPSTIDPETPPTLHDDAPLRPISPPIPSQSEPSSSSSSSSPDKATTPTTFQPLNIDVPTSSPSRWAALWADSAGMLLVLGGEMFGTLMVSTTRLLEMGEGGEEGLGEGMGTLQILFIRFSLTLVLSSLYMYFARVPFFPFGPPQVRWMLIFRGIAGFVGVFTFYISLPYLPISQAIIIGFLVPLFTAYASYMFLGQPFHRHQLIAGLVSFAGVIIMINPFNDAGPTEPAQHITAAQRLMAVGLGLVADLGMTAVFTLIRLIGTQAHPLITVNFYSMMTVTASGAILLLPIIPGQDFALPRSTREWWLLVGNAVSGFGLQILMTVGLTLDKSAKATNVMYAQIIFAVMMDWAIWGVIPAWNGWIGGVVVVTATVWGSLAKAKSKGEGDEEYAAVATNDFVVGEEVESSEDEEDNVEDGTAKIGTSTTVEQKKQDDM